jgi:pimeloyl-ACP methyl ester carboxylesterase
MADFALLSREISWKVLDIDIFGTLTYPDDGLSHPGIVMVAGSGPTDRDWCSPLLPGKNGSGKLLAETLAGEGYAIIRYDKMASGPHVRENLPKFAGKASMETHLQELAGAVSALASQTNVIKEKIYALTNSEGGIHAVNYQLSERNPKFRALVLTGAPGRSVKDIARSQLNALGKSYPNAGRILEKYDRAVNQFLLGNKMDIEDSLPEGVKLMLNSLESPNNLPFSRELWNYYLPEYLKKIREPVLIVIGNKDIQVNWKDDGKVLESTLADKGNVDFAYPENADHLLKHVDLPLEMMSAEFVAAHYNSDESHIDAEAVQIITKWLKRL